jgi:DNA-damage-inducible protein J
MFARVVVRERRLPFDVAVDPFYDERNIRHLLRVKADADAGRNMSVHELIED